MAPDATPLFFVVLGALLVQRLAELARSSRHVDALVARGGRVVEDDGYGLLVFVHGALFFAATAEWVLSPYAGLHPWTIPALVGYAGAEALRQWSMRALGDRWTTKVVVLPEAPLVAGGPYRWMRHPIYVAVGALVVLLPLAFGLYATAATLGTLNALALARRIRKEERAIAPPAASAAFPTRSTGP